MDTLVSPNNEISTLNSSTSSTGSTSSANGSAISTASNNSNGNSNGSSKDNISNSGNTLLKFKKIISDISNLTLKKSTINNNNIHNQRYNNNFQSTVTHQQFIEEDKEINKKSSDGSNSSDINNSNNVNNNANQCFLMKNSSGEIKTNPPDIRYSVNGFPKLTDVKKKEYQWFVHVTQWNVNIDNNNSNSNNKNDYPSILNEEISKLVKLGIPKRIRGFIWRLSSGSIELEKKNTGVYQFFLSKSSGEYEYKIAKDIARTFPNVPFFCREEGQNCLFNILKAYAVMDPEIGYTQGMSFIAAVLLSEMDELESFWVFTSIMKNYKLSTLYSNDLGLLRQYLYVIDRLIETFLPKLFSHFKEIGVTPVLFASEWISTLFTYNFNIKISKRLLDVFFIQGRLYLHKISISILKIYEKQLVSLEFEEAVEFLKHLGYQIDPDVLFKVSDSLSIPNETIENFEAEFIHPNAPSDYF